VLRFKIKVVRLFPCPNAVDIQRGVRTCQRGAEYEGFLTSNVIMLLLALLVMAAMAGPDTTTVAIGVGESPDPRLPRVRVGFEDVPHVARGRRL
jgi:hypothetical protein